MKYREITITLKPCSDELESLCKRCKSQYMHCDYTNVNLLFSWN